MKQTSLPIGGVGVIVDFETVGEVFGEHRHAVEQNHVTVVARGGISAFGETQFNGQEFRAGAVIVWDAPLSHGFQALTDDTRIVNIQLREQIA